MNNHFPLFDLGGGFGNLMDGPVTATRVTSSGFNEIALNTGIFNPTGNSWLNPKFIRTNSLGQNTACPDAYTENCLLTYGPTSIIPEDYGTETAWASSISSATNPLTRIINTLIPQSLPVPLNCSIVYRPADEGGDEDQAAWLAVPVVRESMATETYSSGDYISAYPNSATGGGYVRLSISSDLVDNPEPVRVVLCDMSGRVVGMLYEGKAEGLPTKDLRLPGGLSEGLYLLTVQQGQAAHQVKISVQ